MSDSQMTTIHETRTLMLEMEARADAHTPEIQRRLASCKDRIELIFHYEYLAQMIEGV
jgi:hypothetical protein